MKSGVSKPCLVGVYLGLGIGLRCNIIVLRCDSIVLILDEIGLRCDEIGSKWDGKKA